jgi:transient receptor potential cation channel subfamily M protein 2
VIEFDGKADNESKNETIEKFINFMQQRWGLEMPDCILSLTGAAKNFDVKYTDALTKVKAYLKGLAGEFENTWIITGGSNSGVQ